MTDLGLRQAIGRDLLTRPKAAGLKPSPLYPAAAYFVCIGRWFGLDGRLAVAIAWAETQYATSPRMSPADLPGHNAWGFGHPPGSTHGRVFDSWPDGIAAVTEWLAVEYVGKGFDTIEKIAPKWTGSKTPSTWIANASKIMVELGGDPGALAVPKLARGVRP